MEDNQDEPLHVLDLPQLYTRPSPASLLSALDLLALSANTWEQDDIIQSPFPKPKKQQVHPAGVTQWLVGIIASPLSWIPDETTRDEIKELTSTRLSERAGRTAMPSFTRTFTPLPSSPSQLSQPLTIHLHEPSLTADNLGLKTWASSHLLSKRLSSLSKSQNISPSARILELGAGTGLVGITAACLFPASTVHLTDLPPILPNLAANVALNAAAFAAYNVRALPTTAVLDWAEPPRGLREEERFDLVLAADPLYDEEHPRLLVDAVVACLKKGEGARVVVEVPLREGYARERGELRRRMGESGFGVLEEGEERGVDDWGSVGGEVRCWWGVWGWVLRGGGVGVSGTMLPGDE